MKEKLVEEWLINAHERGGIDQAFGQYLISEGHEILWLGHSATEFGKDIISLAPDGAVHAFQIKDENINLSTLRSIDSQLTELIETPPVHPRIPSGTSHVPHLISSGLINEPANQQIRAKNEGLTMRNLPTLVTVDRRGLVHRFVSMSDSFWPEQPTHFRDFLSFHLSNGRGDFAPAMFSSILKSLLHSENESTNRRGQRVAAVGLLGNILLQPFERTNDHWSLCQGWTLVAGHIAWFAAKHELPRSKWIGAFELAKSTARQEAVKLSNEALKPSALRPKDFEFDDYTRSRNLIIASVLAATSLIGGRNELERVSEVDGLLTTLFDQRRFFLWGESAVAMAVLLNLYTESRSDSLSGLKIIEEAVLEITARNTVYSDDEPFEPPHVSADEILAKLFCHEREKQKRRQARVSWCLKSLLGFLARRGQRDFLEANWPAISKIQLVNFLPLTAEDILLWRCDGGREDRTLPEKTQSWGALVKEAKSDLSGKLPTILVEDRDFLILFALVYPHRLNDVLLTQLDHQK